VLVSYHRASARPPLWRARPRCARRGVLVNRNRKEELAKVERKSRQRISEWLRFGRFLEFAGSTSNPAIGKISESKFNGKGGCWRRTEPNPNERIRFRAVLRISPERRF
jgi:hypothetical protein